MTQLSEIFDSLISDYENHRVQDLLSQAIDLLSNRQSVSEHQYAKSAEELHKRANYLAELNSYNTMSWSDREFLDNSQFGPILPNKISKLILQSVPLSRSRGAPSSEIAFFLNLLNENLNKLYIFRGIVSDLPLQSFSYGPGEVAFRISVSNRSFGGDLAELSNVFEQFDRFLLTVRNAITPHEEKPRLLYLDNGSAVAVMVGTIIVVQSVISMYSAIVESANLTVNLLKAMGVIKSADSDAIISQDQIDKIAERFLEESINKQLEIISAESKREFSQDARSSLKITSSVLVEKVLQGSQITVNTISERKLDELANVPNVDPQDAPKLIEKSLGLEKMLALIVAHLEPKLQIEGPKQGGEQIDT